MRRKAPCWSKSKGSGIYAVSLLGEVILAEARGSGAGLVLGINVVAAGG